VEDVAVVPADASEVLMRNTLVVILALCTTLAAQDAGKRVVEQPLKKSLAPLSEKVDLSRTGIDWEKGLGAALNRGKPILLFQLLGNFDDRYC
jgi:hypothetical protein